MASVWREIAGFVLIRSRGIHATASKELAGRNVEPLENGLTTFSSFRVIPD
jgi:hypothetical protein